MCSYFKCDFQEFEFIRFLFANLVSPGSHALDELDMSGYDWAVVQRLIDNHRFWGVAAGVVNDYKEAFPDSFVCSLNRKFKHKSLQNMQLIALMAELTQALKAEGIDYVALKGPFLSQLYYGSPNARFSHDLDILVDRTDLMRTDALIKSMGFDSVDPPFALNQVDLFLRRSKHLGYRHRERGLLLEIHARIEENEDDLGASPELCRSRTRMVTINGCELRVFDEEFLLLYLCYHGSKHYWKRLFWLADILVIKRSMGEACERSMLSLMREFGGTDRYEMAVQLAHSLTDIAHPACLRGYPGYVSGMVFYMWNVTCTELPGTKESLPVRIMLNSQRSHIFFMKGIGNKLGRLLRWAFLPSLNDYGVINLPAFLSWLYYLVRPARIMAYLFSRALSVIRR